MATDKNSFAPYLQTDFSFAVFTPQARVLDVGCGGGRHLLALRANGCEAIGVEPDHSESENCRQAGFTVFEGKAEQLPIADASVDGIVCCVVIPYTHEQLAVAEWARVLVPEGEVRASFIGLGYALRYLTIGSSIRERIYGARMILNTWFYSLTGYRLPGFLGDTLYQSERRLARYYQKCGFELVSAAQGKKFLGLPVLTYHHLRKVSRIPATALTGDAPQMTRS